MVVMLKVPVWVTGIPSNIYWMVRALVTVRERLRLIFSSRTGSSVALMSMFSEQLTVAGETMLSEHRSHPRS